MTSVVETRHVTPKQFGCQLMEYQEYSRATRRVAEMAHRVLLVVAFVDVGCFVDGVVVMRIT